MKIFKVIGDIARKSGVFKKKMAKGATVCKKECINKHVRNKGE